MSNGVFNFNFLALLLSEILGGPKFTLVGPTPPGRPLAEKCLYPSEYFTISNCVFNFNIGALVVSEILGGSQIYVRGPCAPLYAPERKLFYTRGEYVTMSNGIVISTFKLFYFLRY